MNYMLNVPCPVCHFPDVESNIDHRGVHFRCTHYSCLASWDYHNYDVIDTMLEHLFDRAQEENEDV